MTFDELLEHENVMNGIELPGKAALMMYRAKGHAGCDNPTCLKPYYEGDVILGIHPLEDGETATYQEEVEFIVCSKECGETLAGAFFPSSDTTV